MDSMSVIDRQGEIKVIYIPLELIVGRIVVEQHVSVSIYPIRRVPGWNLCNAWEP